MSEGGEEESQHDNDDIVDAEEEEEEEEKQEEQEQEEEWKVLTCQRKSGDSYSDIWGIWSLVLREAGSRNVF